MNEAGKEAAPLPVRSNVGLGDELVLYVEKSRWEFLKQEAGNRFCIQAYTTVENENGFIKFRASPNYGDNSAGEASPTEPKAE